jgi:hypothetical protein
MYLYHRVACCCVAACLRDVLPGTTAVRCDMLPFVYTNAPHRSPTALKRSPSLRRHHPRSPQPARLPHSSSRHLRSAHTAVSHFTTSQTAQSHRPPPLPDVQHGRRPGKSAPITPLHLPPARTAAANRLRTPPTAALVARRHRVCPARPRRCRDTGSGASQRALAPRPSSPACRLTPHSALVARGSARGSQPAAAAYMRMGSHTASIVHSTWYSRLYRVQLYRIVRSSSRPYGTGTGPCTGTVATVLAVVHT